MGAFDATRPPEPSLIEDCVHCGFCLPTCPTYVLWGEEMDSPRGRVLLMRAAHEEGPSLTRSQVEAWDNCLGCMACVTACPSGVQYHKLIEDTHAQVVREQPRALLRAIPALELLEPAERELCCGSAGVYNLLKPEAAAELGQRKARNLRAT